VIYPPSQAKSNAMSVECMWTALDEARLIHDAIQTAHSASEAQELDEALVELMRRPIGPTGVSFESAVAGAWHVFAADARARTSGYPLSWLDVLEEVRRADSRPCYADLGVVDGDQVIARFRWLGGAWVVYERRGGFESVCGDTRCWRKSQRRHWPQAETGPIPPCSIHGTQRYPVSYHGRTVKGCECPTLQQVLGPATVAEVLGDTLPDTSGASELNQKGTSSTPLALEPADRRASDGAVPSSRLSVGPTTLVEAAGGHPFAPVASAPALACALPARAGDLPADDRCPDCDAVVAADAPHCPDCGPYGSDAVGSWGESPAEVARALTQPSAAQVAVVAEVAARVEVARLCAAETPCEPCDAAPKDVPCQPAAAPEALVVERTSKKPCPVCGNLLKKGDRYSLRGRERAHAACVL